MNFLWKYFGLFIQFLYSYSLCEESFLPLGQFHRRWYSGLLILKAVGGLGFDKTSLFADPADILLILDNVSENFEYVWIIFTSSLKELGLELVVNFLHHFHYVLYVACILLLSYLIIFSLVFWIWWLLDFLHLNALFFLGIVMSLLFVIF